MSKFKLFLNGLAAVGLILVIYFARDSIREAFLYAREDFSLLILSAQIPVHAAGLLAMAHFYYSYFKNMGSLGLLKIKSLYKIVLELSFVNRAMSAGGVGGFTYLSLRLKPFDINISSSTFAQSMRFALTFASFLPILGLGLVILAISGNANDLVLLLSGGIFLSTIFLGAIAIFLISDKKRIKAFISWLPKVIDKIIVLIRYKSKKSLINIAKLESGLDNIHSIYVKVSKDWSILIKPLFYAFLLNIFELLTIYIVFLAFNVVVNPGAIILAYSVANIAGLIALLPGGIGIYEFLMAAILEISGVPRELAIAGTIVYRVANFFILLIPGMIFYYLAVNKDLVMPSVKK